MANTIISPVIFAKEVIRNRDRKNVFLPHTNRDYEGEIRQAWDTVTVQTLPTLNFTAQSTTKIAAVAAVAQISTVTITDGASWDDYVVVIDGQAYTVDDTGGALDATGIAEALVVLIDESTIVDVASTTNVVTITAKSAGNAFTIANTGSTTGGNVVIATPTANVVAVSGNIVATGPGGVISPTDFTITVENLLIDRFAPLLVQITKHQATQSNLSLEASIAGRFAEAEARLFDDQVRDQILVTQVADIPVANKINEFAPYTPVKATIFAEIEKMRVALAVQNVTDNLSLFVSPSIQSILIQSDIMDATETGLGFRTKGYIGMVSGVAIYTSNALTESWEMIMMADNSVNMVVQLNDYKVTEWEKGFYFNLLAEIVWGMKIFWENAKAISINYTVA